MGPDVTLIPNMMQATSAASSYVQSFTEAILAQDQHFKFLQL